MEFEETADHFVELGPCAGGGGVVGMVAVGGGMDAGQAFAAFDEVQERLAAKVRGGLVVWIVQEFAGGAGKEDGVILLQILRGDGGRIVGDGGHPGTGFVAEVFDHLRCQGDGGVDPAESAAKDQHTAQALRRGVGLIGQGGHHGRDVGGVRKLSLRTAASEAPLKSVRRAIRETRRSRLALCESHSAGPYEGG